MAAGRFLGRSFVRSLMLCAIVTATLTASACRETTIARGGPPQQRLMSRVYPRGVAELRTLILGRYAAAHETLSPAFRVLQISEQPPPGFGPDWLVGYVDPGGFLEPYRRLPSSERANDLVLREPTEDKYWLSEYQTATAPVLFRCALVLHLIERSPTETEVQVFEIVPTVLVGRRWAMAKEGIGWGRYRDIRFVEPTVTERQAVLDFVGSILQ